MIRPKFHDVDMLGRAAGTRRGRGLDALIPTAPAPDLRAIQWKYLDAALFSLTNAQFEYERGEHEAGRVHVEDCRRALGALALTLADGPDAEGYARLFAEVVAEPKRPER